MDLYERKIEIQVGKISISSHYDPNSTGARVAAIMGVPVGANEPILGIDFNVIATGTSEPNTGTITLFNLTDYSIAQFAEKNPVIINAGYKDTCQHIFTGDIKTISHSKQGVLKVSTIECGDGSAKYNTAMMNMSYRSGTDMKKMLMDAIQKLGVGIGNSAAKILGPEFAAGVKKTTAGIVNSGRVKDVLNKLCKATGQNWSIQNGELQLLEDDEVTKEAPIYLSHKTGLIGSPTVGEKGIVKFKSQLQGGFKPGRMVMLESYGVNGYYKTISVNHAGSTYGPDWFSDCEGKPLKTLAGKI